MALVHSPSIVTNGLNFYYDMNNTQKSWKGAPATNLIPYSQDYGSNGNFMANWTGNLFSNWINSVVTTGYQAPDGSYTANLLTGYYSRWTASITAATSTTYTFSIWLKNNGLTHPVDLHVAFGLNGGLVNYNNIASVPIASIGNWTRFSVTVTSPSSGINQIQCGVDFGASRSGSAGPYSVAVWGAQLETGSYATPYIPSLGASTSRSSTQAILDLTDSSEITTNSSISYLNNNTFEFLPSNSNSTLIVPLSTSLNKLTGTINTWIYPRGYSNSNGIFVNRDNSIANALDWLWIGAWNSGSIFYFRLGNGGDCCSQDLTVSNWSSVCPVNTWSNVCVTWQSGSFSRIYVNGNLIASRTITAIPNTNPSATGRIGLGHDASGTGSWNGIIQNFSIFNRALSDAEVRQNFNALRGRYGL